MNNKPVKTLKTIADSIHCTGENHAMAQTNQCIEIHPINPLQHTPYRVKLETIRQLSDDQLLRVLTGQAGETRPVNQASQQAITAELLRRQMEMARKPHKPSFALLIVSVVLAALGVILAALALPQVQKFFVPPPPAAQQAQSLTEGSLPLSPGSQLAPPPPK